MTLQTPKPKEWKSWRRYIVFRPLHQKTKTLQEMSEQTLWREPRAPKTRKTLSSLLIECLRSSSVLSHEKYQFRSIWPSAEFLTAIDNKERCLQMLRKLFFRFGIWQTLLWFLTLETLCCGINIRGSRINQTSGIRFPNNRFELQPKLRYWWRLSPEQKLNTCLSTCIHILREASVLAALTHLV